MRGQKVHHSVDVRAAWWGVTVDKATDDEDVVIDLGIGRAASAAAVADLTARARKVRRKE